MSPGSNVALDFHGDPATAGLAVYSDGNHHMALEAAIRAFVAEHPDVDDVFYTTTPPAPLVDALKGEGLVLGNLRIGRKPDVFISPTNILEGLAAANLVSKHVAFAESRGNVLLVRKGNPKGIKQVKDLLSDAITLTCSNPVNERASFEVYEEAIRCLAGKEGVDEAALIDKLTVAGPNTVHSQVIHHREVPTLIGLGPADVAIIYYHLALRYTRIFPDLFEIVDVAGVEDGGNTGDPTTRYHVGLVADGGLWGERFMAFMQSEAARAAYASHGLRAAW